MPKDISDELNELNAQMDVMRQDTDSAADTLQKRIEHLLAGYQELNHYASLAPLGISTNTHTQGNIHAASILDEISDDPVLQRNRSILHAARDRKIEIDTDTQMGLEYAADPRACAVLVDQESLFDFDLSHPVSEDMIASLTRQILLETSQKHRDTAAQRVMSQSRHGVDDIVLKNGKHKENIDLFTRKSANAHVDLRISQFDSSDSAAIKVAPVPKAAKMPVIAKNMSSTRRVLPDAPHGGVSKDLPSSSYAPKLNKGTCTYASDLSVPSSSIGVQVDSERRTMPAISFGLHCNVAPTRPEALKRLFHDLDSDRDGLLDFEEARIGLTRVGCTINRRKIRHYFELCCKNRQTSLITRQEFMALVMAVVDNVDEQRVAKQSLIRSNPYSSEALKTTTHFEGPQDPPPAKEAPPLNYQPKSQPEVHSSAAVSHLSLDSPTSADTTDQVRRWLPDYLLSAVMSDIKSPIIDAVRTPDGQEKEKFVHPKLLQWFIDNDTVYDHEIVQSVQANLATENSCGVPNTEDDAPRPAMNVMVPSLCDEQLTQIVAGLLLLNWGDDPLTQYTMEIPQDAPDIIVKDDADCEQDCELEFCEATSDLQIATEDGGTGDIDDEKLSYTSIDEDDTSPIDLSGPPKGFFEGKDNLTSKSNASSAGASEAVAETLLGSILVARRSEIRTNSLNGLLLIAGGKRRARRRASQLCAPSQDSVEQSIAKTKNEGVRLCIDAVEDCTDAHSVSLCSDSSSNSSDIDQEISDGEIL